MNDSSITQYSNDLTTLRQHLSDPEGFDSLTVLSKIPELRDRILMAYKLGVEKTPNLFSPAVEFQKSEISFQDALKSPGGLGTEKAFEDAIDNLRYETIKNVNRRWLAGTNVSLKITKAQFHKHRESISEEANTFVSLNIRNRLRNLSKKGWAQLSTLRSAPFLKICHLQTLLSEILSIQF